MVLQWFRVNVMFIGNNSFTTDYPFLMSPKWLESTNINHFRMLFPSVVLHVKKKHSFVLWSLSKSINKRIYPIFKNERIFTMRRIANSNPRNSNEIFYLSDSIQYREVLWFTSKLLSVGEFFHCLEPSVVK